MRILGITIPEEKRLEIGLLVLFGIGRSRARTILEKAGVPLGIKSKDVSIEQENKIRSVIEGMTLEGDLKREITGNIKRLKDIKTYRGMRHLRNLPVRGQRTKTNARTKRGARKTMGTGRKIAEKK
ncbi:MAG: 30S ribosomal protein S13 [Parcubacteria group bacterium GW2011_GWB1_38_8]|uniref:Small ribosomal subunit protein uS13 n=1 Tax=Candidatus Zambryskibacteria bacterium RIFCSPLOWO2_02_FULL_39_14 TaxID=1802769 RepID=A0A1G2UF39_9BACT|nr:MAG: 30S ribosomal protein S13 [Parcubacteria group bacterium GW2011_GWB1_38_8]KKR31021.1 MAG: 30S ribosomal protein S13 [Parcubacteria group bacterium GW2011_GWC1_39_8]OHA95649.1 MAG: 30S ribosomal protein S13 [Candidatus Zambryskibacteria bacterium RIFCSPHIGHO2_02_FULL_39_16]OHB08037.1 MAG: 30S ribosomal protein S13 [Candidatus Zambryskibacteria bacterium RIFCSPLOWO2_02_FULL_39_14]